jgi:peptidoglycan/xylan/chitin deacetylase (PgdA/CDA1 family)
VVLTLSAGISVTGCTSADGRHDVLRPSGGPPRSPAPSVSAKPGPTPSAGATPPKTGKPLTGKGPAGSMRVTGSAAVALTFDDGPDPKYTPKILDLLRKNGVKATFCLVGTRAKAYPQLVRRIAAEGHTLCNHSWKHLLDLGKTSGGKPVHSDAYIKKDLQKTTDAILAAVPIAQVRYFRAPGGLFTGRLVKIAKSMGMTSLYWAVDPQDWNTNTYGNGTTMVKHVVSVVEHKTKPGAIILSHDMNKPATIKAYATLLPWLKKRFTLIALPAGPPQVSHFLPGPKIAEKSPDLPNHRS